MKTAEKLLVRYQVTNTKTPAVFLSNLCSSFEVIVINMNTALKLAHLMPCLKIAMLGLILLPSTAGAIGNAALRQTCRSKYE